MKLYQINLTNDEVNAANSGQKFPKLTAYRDAMCLGYFAGREFYEHVADLATDDLEEAFGIGNIGPEDKITRYARMHSVSVGDVLVNSAGQAYIVQNIGFAHIEGWGEPCRCSHPTDWLGESTGVCSKCHKPLEF